jgi:mono/diheme cytochrome c family protein
MVEQIPRSQGGAVRCTNRKILALGILAAMFIVIAVPVSAGEAVTYEKDIKGIIAKGCIACHGSNAPTMEEFKRDQE